MQTDFSAFRHRYPVRVRSYQVDRLNAVHNLWYFYYFEEARVEFVREIGMPIGEETFVTKDRFYVAHNSCDYLAPALFDEELEILTRISRVGNSSVTFEQYALRSADGVPVARAAHVLVHVSTEDDRPMPLPDGIRSLLAAHEGPASPATG